MRQGQRKKGVGGFFFLFFWGGICLRSDCNVLTSLIDLRERIAFLLANIVHLLYIRSFIIRQTKSLKETGLINFIDGRERLLQRHIGIRCMDEEDIDGAAELVSAVLRLLENGCSRASNSLRVETSCRFGVQCEATRCSGLAEDALAGAVDVGRVDGFYACGFQFVECCAESGNVPEWTAWVDSRSAEYDFDSGHVGLSMDMCMYVDNVTNVGSIRVFSFFGSCLICPRDVPFYQLQVRVACLPDF